MTEAFPTGKFEIIWSNSFCPETCQKPVKKSVRRIHNNTVKIKNKFLFEKRGIVIFGLKKWEIEL